MKIAPAISRRHQKRAVGGEEAICQKKYERLQKAIGTHEKQNFLFVSRRLPLTKINAPRAAIERAFSNALSA